ncbi:hypothetical protein Patl1_24504 [Pistacia atlantica]|uniref:Uncharacterized protein n=1 Tax=Pistacia atlantica TaxID=434234 RepID=A0ACC1A0Y4_9ROSI|nr:hypothetical protein Patl1_24504 [Pistacia atlantica]
MAVHLHYLLLHIIILLVWAIKASAVHCPTTCGNVSEIRYPFGIGDRCYFNEWFAVTCDKSSGSSVPFFSRTNLTLAEDISRRSNGMAIGLSAYVDISKCYNLSGTPFSYSHKLNKFIARGCDNYTTTLESNQIKSATRCLPICTCDPAKNSNCYDFMCTISSSHQFFSDISVPGNCKSAVMVEQDWLKTNYLANSNPNVLNEREHVPVVMEFGRYMGSCAEPYNYKSHKTVCIRDDFCLIQLDSAYFCVCSQPKRNHDEPGCTGTDLNHEFKLNSCPDGYASNISQNVDGKLTCYPDPLNGPREEQRHPHRFKCCVGNVVPIHWSAEFVRVMEEDCPFEIFDARVFKDDRQQEIETFANLTRRCLDSNESKRPTMEEVATKLEGIRTSNGALISKQNRLEIKFEINCEAEIGCSSLSDCCCSGITG